MVYEKLVEHWWDDLTEEEFQILREFSRQMDRNSLNLVRMEFEEEPVAFYTDEADWYRFTISEMKGLLEQLDGGMSWSWEQITERHRLDARPTRD